MKLKALIFDTDNKSLALITQLLKARGYEYHYFPHAGTCPIVFADRCPCPAGNVCAVIIITENTMPGIKGLHLINDQIKRGCVRGRTTISYWQ